MAFILMLTVLSIAVAGTIVAYLQVVSHYKNAASQLERTLSLSSTLTDAITAHEQDAHLLWNGVNVDRAVYLRQQEQISRLFDAGLAAQHSPKQHQLLLHASQIWRDVLTSRGLWGPTAAPGHKVTLAMQQQFGGDSDEVAITLSQLSQTAIADGSEDLATADSLRSVVVGLLAAMLALVVAVVLYLARRMTTDVVRPLEMLQRAAARLREGDLNHRVELAVRRRSNELSELTETFNEMAGALDEGHRTLSRRATCDSLTGLPNRAAFQRLLESHLAPAPRRRPEAVGVLFIDVDDFKFINDSLGHAAGDAVLVDIAERLSTCVRPSDLVARLGGDEFVILVNDQLSASNSAEVIAGRILDAFNAPFTIADQQVSVAVSIGISVARHDTDDAERLLGEADLAMYSAKRHGKGHHEVFDASMQN